MAFISQEKLSSKDGNVNYYVTLVATVLCVSLWLAGGAQQLQAQAGNNAEGGGGAAVPVSTFYPASSTGDLCNVTYPNTPPVVDPTSSMTVLAGQVETITIGAYDTQGQVVTLSATGQGVTLQSVAQDPSWASSGGRASAVIKFSAPTAGDQAINVTARDASGASTLVQIPIKVLPANPVQENKPILFGPIQYQTVQVGQSVNFQVYAYDSDSYVSLRPATLPQGATWDIGTTYEGYHVINVHWAPQSNQAGIHDIELSATDMGPLLTGGATTPYLNRARANIRIKVVNSVAQCSFSGNSAPLMDPLTSVQLKQGQTTVIPVGALDNENQTMTVSMTGQDFRPNQTFNNEPGRIGMTGLYTANALGTHYLTFFVKDQGMAATVMTLPISVVPANQTTNAPIRFGAIHHEKVRVGQSVDFQVYVEDADSAMGLWAALPTGASVTFPLMGPPDGANTFVARVHWVPQVSQTGLNDIHFFARDFNPIGFRNVAESTVRFTVVNGQSLPTNSAPILDPVSSVQVLDNTSKTITIGATDSELQPMKIWISGEGVQLPIGIVQNLAGPIIALANLTQLVDPAGPRPWKYDLSIVAQDSRGGATHVSIPVEYLPNGIMEDSQIIFGPIAERTATVGQPLSLQIYARDVNDFLDLLTALPAGAQASLAPSIPGQTTVNINWTPTSADIGKFDIGLLARDNSLSTADQFRNISKATLRVKVNDNIDRTPPTGSLAIYGNATYANATYLPVILSATDSSGVAQMRFSEDDKNWSAWETYAVNKNWNFSATDGVKTLYVQFKDGANPANQSDSYSDTIILDRVRPILGGYIPPTLSNGEYTFSTTMTDDRSGITINPASSPKSGLLAIKLTIDAATGAYTYNPFTIPTTLVSNGNNVYSAKVKTADFGPDGIVLRFTAADNAKNTNSPQQILHRFNPNIGITQPRPIDTTPPTPAPSITNATATATQVSLTWSASLDNLEDGIRYPTNYDVYRNGVKITRVATTTYTDTGLTPSILSTPSNYTYTIVALDHLNNASTSAPVTRTMQQLSTKFTDGDQVWTTSPVTVYQYISDVDTLATNFSSYLGTVIDGPYLHTAPGVGIVWLVYWPELNDSGYVREQYLDKAIVEWNTDPVKFVGVTATPTPNSLTKIAATAWGNGGASSKRGLVGNFGVQFTAVQTTTQTMIGLSNTDSTAHFNTIQFAIFLFGTTAPNDVPKILIYENGTSNGVNYGSYKIGDVFAVERLGNMIVYRQNERVITVSSRSSSGDLALYVDTALYEQGARISDVKYRHVIVKAPDAIYNLEGSSGDTQVQLFWNAPFDNGSTISGYGYDVMYRRIDPLAGPGPDPDLNRWLNIHRDAVPGHTINSLINDKRYEFKVIANNALGASPESNVVTVKPTFKIDVTWWTDIVNVTGVTTNTITKSAAITWGNGGAATPLVFRGNGGVEFTAASTSTHVVCGLSTTNKDANSNSIHYGLYLNGGKIQVFESGTTFPSITGDYGTYAINDKFSVEKTNTTVRYKQNGRVFRTIDTGSTASLLVDTAIYEQFASINEVRIVGVAASAPDKINDLSGVYSDRSVQLFWTAPPNNGYPITGYDMQHAIVPPPLQQPVWTTVADDAIPGGVINTGLTNGTAYLFRVTAKNNTPGNGIGIASDTIPLTPNIKTAVTWWTDIVNVTGTTTNTITKSAATTWGNGGAATPLVFSGDGGVEFVAANQVNAQGIPNTHVVCGLSRTNKDAHYNSINYGLYLNGGVIQVFEDNITLPTTGNYGTYKVGDIFAVTRKITTSGTTITYSQNGRPFRSIDTIDAGTPASLLVDTALYEQGAILAGVKIINLVAQAPDPVRELYGYSTNNSVQLFWNTPPNNASPITSYDVQYGTGFGLTQFNVSSGVVINIPNSNGIAQQLRVVTNAGNLSSTSLPITITPEVEVNVVWNPAPAKFVGVTATPTANSLTKTAPTTWGNAGASSSATISGNGRVKFTVAQTNTSVICGLSYSDTNQSDTSFSFGLYLDKGTSVDKGTLRVYEGTTLRGPFGEFKVGDVVSVEREGTTIRYRHNGRPIASATATNASLLVDTALYEQNSIISNVRVTGAQ